MKKLNMPKIHLKFVDNNVKHFIFCIYFDLHRRNSTTITTKSLLKSVMFFNVFVPVALLCTLQP